MRIIAVVPVLNDIHVQSYNFKSYLPIGSPKVSLEFLSKWEADEIFLLNIKGSIKINEHFYKKVKEFSKNCFVPLTVGGGIKSTKDVEKLIKNGADKVSINSHGISDKSLIKNCSKEFGKQAIIGCVDVKKKGNKFYVYTHSGTKKSKFNLVDACEMYEDNGAGEILIQSIDNDGTKKGFDEKILKSLSNKINIPLIICGGANNFKHFLLFKKYNISGLAAANLFTFTEQSVFNLKKKLKINLKNIRI